ncbi:Transcriptional regulatory protein ComA [compost metagenome]
MARGFKSKEIAYELGIAERTVKAHLTSIYNKLGVDSRPQAVALALERGILQN